MEFREVKCSKEALNGLFFDVIDICVIFHLTHKFPKMEKSKVMFETLGTII